jgi:hypothetical protein
MAVRMSIPLPGPFTVAVRGGRTVWRHADCSAPHRTRADAEQHAQRFAALTPVQRLRAQRWRAVLSLTAVGIFAANVLIVLGVAIFLR